MGRKEAKNQAGQTPLRFAAGKLELNEKEKKKIVKRLFGSECEDEKALKGKLYFFPTFFEDEAGKDVITPFDRKTRTPVKGKAPIPIEIMTYPKGEDFKEE